MLLVPFFNVSYVKSDFHLMTVAASFMLRGAGSNALSISSFDCANVMAETASIVKTAAIIRFILCPPVQGANQYRSLGCAGVSIEFSTRWRLLQPDATGNDLSASITLGTDR